MSVRRDFEEVFYRESVDGQLRWDRVFQKNEEDDYTMAATALAWKYYKIGYFQGALGAKPPKRQKSATNPESSAS